MSRRPARQIHASTRLKRLKRNARSLATRCAFAVVTAPFAAAPLPWVQAFGRLMARAAWRSNRRYARTRKHLRLAFPEWSDARLDRVTRECGIHVCVTVCELLHILGKDLETVAGYVDVEGWEHVEAARKEPRPTIFLMAHYGNWELLGPTINGRGVGMLGFARQMQDPWLEELILQMRERLGTPRMILRGAPGAGRLLVRTLRENGAIAVLHDQDIRVEGTWVPFFGRPAFTPIGPARLALKHDANVVPVFVERQEDGRHVARFQPALDLPNDLIGATALMTRVIEDQVRKRPEQWAWFHRRWRHQPDDPEAPPAIVTPAGRRRE